MPTHLTASQENYLEQILRLGRRPVRVRDIADAAGVKLPSVTRAIGKLVEGGLARHEAYGRVEITEKGLVAAQLVMRRDECLTRLLVHVLGVPAGRAEAEVCRMEHTLGDEVLGRLEVLVDWALAPRNGRWRAGLKSRLKALPASSGSRGGVRVGAGEPHVRGGAKEVES